MSDFQNEFSLPSKVLDKSFQLATSHKDTKHLSPFGMESFLICRMYVWKCITRLISLRIIGSDKVIGNMYSHNTKPRDKKV